MSCQGEDGGRSRRGTAPAYGFLVVSQRNPLGSSSDERGWRPETSAASRLLDTAATVALLSQRAKDVRT